MNKFIYSLNILFQTQEKREDFFNKMSNVLGEELEGAVIAEENIEVDGELELVALDLVLQRNMLPGHEQCEKSSFIETVEALRDAGGVVSVAADLLGVSPSAVYKRIKRFSIYLEDFRED